MLRYIPFQSGSDGNTALLYNETTVLVLDAGVSPDYVRETMLLYYGINILEKKLFVLVTHKHKDHSRYIEEGKKYTTNVISPMDNQITDNNSLWDLNFSDNEYSYDDGYLSIKSMEMRHDVKCWGFIIRLDGQKVVGFTDTTTPPYYQPDARDADVYLVEGNYSGLLLPMNYNDGSEEKQNMYGEFRSRHLEMESLLNGLNEVVTRKTKHIHILHITNSIDQIEYMNRIRKQFDKPGIRITNIISEEIPKNHGIMFEYGETIF